MYKLQYINNVQSCNQRAAIQPGKKNLCTYNNVNEILLIDHSVYTSYMGLVFEAIRIAWSIRLLPCQ